MTEGPPSVSVIVIFFNGERFLEDAIQSVLGQTSSDWELLLVDDGSTDGSTELAQRYAAKHVGRIQYLEHEGHDNRGISASRNLGIRHAQGQYHLCLDSDDVLLPHGLEVFVGLLTKQPTAAMVYGPLQYWYSWTRDVPYGRAADFVQSLGVAADALIEPPTLLGAFIRRRAAVPSGMMVRASVTREVGGYEETFRGMYEDQVFCAKVALTRWVLTSSVCIYRYRQHPHSSSAVADRSGEYEFGRLAFLEWLIAYLRSSGPTDPDLWRAVRGEVWWTRHPRLGRLRRATRRARRRLGSILPRALTALRSARRPPDYAGENARNVGQMTRSAARLGANPPDSQSGVAPEKP